MSVQRTARGPQADLPKVYDPAQVERRWYATWEERGYFHVEATDPGQPFSVVIPPPNVTGSLHMGHALNNTLQDVLVRWRRMQGFKTMWLPGTDHAGIATQHVVEEALAREGISRQELGRERFLQRVWAWKEEYGGRIIQQLKRLGCSCDWRRERFTMDEGCSKAVRRVFVDLFERGLIYQGDYIVNWCPDCRTTLSDIEVEHEEREGRLWHLRYPLTDGSGYIVVATTRPETMLGDTAVAVHPDDERYRHLVGRTVRLPLVGREIPIIADAWVDPEFGTGAVKVTPAHDPNDFEIGQRHNLPQVQVIGFDARMTEAAGPYAGMTREECRQAVVRDLEAQGLLLRTDVHVHAVGQCYRCGTIVEPLVSRQWFVKMKPLAEPAIRAVVDGRIRFVPHRFSKNYLHWMENIRDWCISRQLWWGHRIPVFTCQKCQHVWAAVEDPDTCPRCGGTELVQDPDVLDTWFSSALWPFSTLGWPEDTPDLREFYPTSLLVTGFDIIYFWVARMIFMGLHFMNDVPFRDVLIHGLVRASDGRKMSKSLGNGVDPLDLIEAYGADALRWMLVTGAAPGNDMRYHPEKVEAARNFCNKLWNAARFALMNMRDLEPKPELPPVEQMALPDRWILSRLDWTIGEVTRHLERYDLGEASRALYDFAWSEVCDWYIEAVKPRLYGNDRESRAVAQAVLHRVLKTLMELLHPFMPFLTEEIWQQLAGDEDGPSVVVAPWPRPQGLRDSAAEDAMEVIMDVVRSVRNARSEKNVPLGRKIEAIMHAEGEHLRHLQANAEVIRDLAGIGRLTLDEPGAERPEQAVSLVAAGGVRVFLPLAGLVDLEEERARLAKSEQQLQAEAERLEQRLANESFVTKAPAHVVERERERLRKVREQLDAVRAQLKALGLQ